MTRTVLCVALVALFAGRAHAQGMTTFPNGATVTFDKFYLHEDNNPDLVEPKTTPDSLWHYFNLAHCVCGKLNPGPTDTFKETSFGQRVLITGGDGTPIHRPLEIWTGTECDNETLRPMNCTHVSGADIGDIGTIQSGNGATLEVPLYNLFEPQPAAAGCEVRSQAAPLWTIADGNGDGTKDFFVSKTIDTDTLPPPLPTNFRADGAENAIQISWDAPTGDTSDIFAFQAFCARSDDDSPGKTSDVPSPRYQTPQRLCGAADADVTTAIAGTSPFALQPVDVVVQSTDVDAGTPAGSVTLPPAMAALDETYLCGETVSPTATSLRIEGLENGVSYKVALIAVDKFQNPVGVYFTSALTPVPVTDFWEDLHDRGSKVHGGFCLLAETYGDDSFLTNALRGFRDDTLADTSFGRWLTDVYYATLAKLGAYVHGSTALRIVAMIVLLPIVVFALLWHALTLPGLLALGALLWIARRRRRWLVRLAPAAGLAIVLAPGHARAGGYQPYWENDTVASEDDSAAEEPGLVTWIAGIKVGPYVPQIDAQIGGPSPGPYKQMFGGGLDILPVFELDRILWSGTFGQVGVGGSIGYMGKKAKAWVQGSDPADPMRPRAPGDDNKFRLIPLALTGTYRFTYLDDQYGIPVVPYLRGGLSYYIWYILAPGGDFARVCKDRSMPTCEVDKAVGASAGFQGAIGLSVRAERLDQGAAQSMQQSGIQHAGFYAELSAAKVDGFGSDTKLSVGDTTWFAGVDFEF